MKRRPHLFFYTDVARIVDRVEPRIDVLESERLIEGGAILATIARAQADFLKWIQRSVLFRLPPFFLAKLALSTASFLLQLLANAEEEVVASVRNLLEAGPQPGPPEEPLGERELQIEEREGI